MSAVEKTYITPEEYLALERKSEYKSEYYRGEMFAMTGGSMRRAIIASNIGAELHNRLRGKSCYVMQSDMRVKISASGMYVYPDVVALCGEPQLEDEVKDTLLNPQVVFEVLSDSTEKYDRGTKFEHYRRIPTLAQYVLVSQKQVLVESFTRQEDGSWKLQEVNNLQSVLEIPSLGCQVEVQEIYYQVDFSG